MANFQINVSKLSTDTAYERVEWDEDYQTGEEDSTPSSDTPKQTSFITSPADVEGHRKAKLKCLMMTKTSFAVFVRDLEMYSLQTSRT